MPQVDPLIITVVMFGSMLLLMLIGIPMTFSLGIVAMALTIFLWGTGGIELSFIALIGIANLYILSCLPMFIFMGLILQGAGIADDLFQTVYKVMGGIAI